MQYARRTLLILALAASGSLAGDAAGRLSVSIDPARVEIDQQAMGRQLIRLPALEFALKIEADCGGSQDAASVSISIADTRLTIHRETLVEKAVIEKTVRVPQQQVPPMGIQDFCVADAEMSNEAGSPNLLINDALSAQLSLRCINDDQQQTVLYRTVPLAIDLSCREPSEAQPSESSAAKF